MKTMNKKIISKVLVIGCVAVLMLSACSPRVMTEVTTQQKKVVEGSKKEIRKEVNAIGKQNKKIEEYERDK